MNAALLKYRAINGWRLFGVISIPMSIVIVIASLDADLSTGPGISAMIGFSVRCAIPFIYLAIAASSVQILFPGPISAWWLRNRKYLGLCFAVAMAWQGLFIFIMSTLYREYYFESVYLLRDEIEGSIGYIFLSAMVVTSFRPARKYLSSVQWKLLHTSAIYFLWAYAFSVYWWSLSYSENPGPIDYIFYWTGFLAFGLRIAAWGKKRLKSVKQDSPQVTNYWPFRIVGVVTIICGIAISATGLHWQAPVTAFLTAPNWSANLVLWVPFWPFEPYLSLFIIGLGTWLLTEARSQRDIVAVK
jgi:DMSO/TMAO reductase YedYZ heme-binding membrane subunit